MDNFLYLGTSVAFYEMQLWDEHFKMLNFIMLNSFMLSKVGVLSGMWEPLVPGMCPVVVSGCCFSDHSGRGSRRGEWIEALSSQHRGCGAGLGAG